MANKTITTQILLRNDTLAAWQASSRVLGKGEPAVVFDPNCEAEGYSVKVKFGDGVHTFSELPYSGIDLSDIPLADTTKDGLLSKKDFDKLSKLAAIAYKSLSRNKCICGIMPKGDENDRKEELSSMDNFR